MPSLLGRDPGHHHLPAGCLPRDDPHASGRDTERAGPGRRPAGVRGGLPGQAAIDEVDGYDLLVNNAGIGSHGRLVDTTAADMRRVWETNVLGAMLVARASARHFVGCEAGKWRLLEAPSRREPGLDPVALVSRTRRLAPPPGGARCA